MGAVVSMTRRVPEYQMRVTEANGHTRNKELNGRSKRAGRGRVASGGDGAQAAPGHPPQARGEDPELLQRPGQGPPEPKLRQRQAQTAAQRAPAEPISFARARELMVFQIMQVVSAPMIALTAYYLILPDTRTTSVIIAFVSGFASETILRLLHIAADGLTEKLDPAKSDARA
jgi:hypothetical protein